MDNFFYPSDVSGSMKTTISEVVKDDLCTGCGTCIALCPNEAIELKINEKKGIYFPQLDEDKCNHCGICHKVCPGHNVDFKALNREIFGREAKDILIGNYINCYVGHATDYDIRYNSASGGLITGLLIFALEEGLITGALVTRMKKDKPLEPEPFIARTKEEIIEASKSKYCPVPANIALREIIEASDDEHFAVVGLPCHIHGLRKAQKVNAKLRERVVLCLGIVCNHVPTFKATEFLLENMNIKKEDVISLNYRGLGWPGRMKVETINGNIKSPIIHEYWLGGFGTHFYSYRCTLCCDQTCELADYSFADAWLPEFVSDKIGKSIFVSRTEFAETILKNMSALGKIKVDNLNSTKLIKSQGDIIYDRKKINIRIRFFKLFGKKIPLYETELLKTNYLDYLKTTLLYFRIGLSTKHYLWWWIRIEGKIKIMMNNIKHNENVLKLYHKIIINKLIKPL